MYREKINLAGKGVGRIIYIVCLSREAASSGAGDGLVRTNPFLWGPLPTPNKALLP
jgi:hypothetical protein